jgi:hypothetical protein
LRSFPDERSKFRLNGAAAFGRRSSRDRAVHLKNAPLTGKGLAVPERAPILKQTVMRRILAAMLVLSLLGAQTLSGGGNSWNKIRYAGGTVAARVNPYDWNTTLTVSPDAIVLVFGGRTTARINPDHVTALSYGQEAHRRVADMVALSFIVTPVALFGLLHQSKVHFIAIEYHMDDGKAAGVLLEADKGNYRAILAALKIVTGKPVANEP